MKKWILLPFLLVGLANAGDFTAPQNTTNFQTYNQNYRSTGDGNNAQTNDSVTADSYAHVGGGASTVIKTTGGYLDNITFETLCNGTSAYVLADSSFTQTQYATVITTVPTVSGTVPTNIPLHVRFNNGLTIAVVNSTCTAVVSYR